ncbi:hypothetical protein DL764_002561 [Monosporascus ibericus]|uniref:lytic cellulose monooxygenase (C4-dehydrogenating) n=1 Tax=Monosporascus ibericus TaxID=155417 RepID=A0A4Q4TJY6_9PEZI|nr:hypothetical protein DL764_002561 [Monosporascus ibericus]
MSSYRKSTILAALAGAASVSAHGHVTKITADGVTYDGFDPTSAPYAPQPDSIAWSNGATDNGFVLSADVSNPDIICHLDATNGALIAPVAAGGDVSLTWNQWPESHKGPVIDYLADCGGDCSTVDKTTLKWFKIKELGQLELGAGAGQVGKWADDLLIENGLTWTTTIPASIKPGNYVLRHELIALHDGGNEGKTQMYPQCVNLKITGSGTESPEGVIGTELYTPTDPGLFHNIYNDETNPTYQIPGPAMPTFGTAPNDDEETETAPVVSEDVPVATSSAADVTSAPTSTAASTLATSVTTAEPVPTGPVVSEPTETATPTSTKASTPAPTKGCAGNKKRRSRRNARKSRQAKNRLH